jgi:hypothetical protein
MAKINPEFIATEILEKIPEKWHPKKKRAYAIYEIQRIIDLLGVDQVNKAALSRKYGMDWKTIDKYYTSILNSIPKEQVDIVGTKAELRVIKSFERLSRIASDPNIRVEARIAAERELGNLTEKQIRILESYGRKRKNPLQIQVTGSENLDLSKLMEECKDGIESTDSNSAPK